MLSASQVTMLVRFVSSCSRQPRWVSEDIVFAWLPYILAQHRPARGPLEPFAKRVLRRKAIDYQRACSRERAALRSLTPVGDRLVLSDDAGSFEPLGSRVADTFQACVLQPLDEKQLVLIWHACLEVSHGQIAARLGIKEARSRQALKTAARERIAAAVSHDAPEEKPYSDAVLRLSVRYLVCVAESVFERTNISLPEAEEWWAATAWMLEVASADENQLARMLRIAAAVFSDQDRRLPAAWLACFRRVESAALRAVVLRYLVDVSERSHRAQVGTEDAELWSMSALSVAAAWEGDVEMTRRVLHMLLEIFSDNREVAARKRRITRGVLRWARIAAGSAEPMPGNPSEGDVGLRTNTPEGRDPFKVRQRIRQIFSQFGNFRVVAGADTTPRPAARGGGAPRCPLATWRALPASLVQRGGEANRFGASRA